MKSYTVILYHRNGSEIDRYEDCENLKLAKETARDMLSEEWARRNETTHADLQTWKVAIFKEGARTGSQALCEWDREHPQHAEFCRTAEAVEERIEQERADALNQ